MMCRFFPGGNWFAVVDFFPPDFGICRCFFAKFVITCWTRGSRMLKFRLGAGLLLMLLGTSQVFATLFPRPPELEPAVKFWTDVFTRYSQHQVVLHDRHHTHVVYKVLDFSEVVPLLDAEELWLHKRKIETEEKAALKAQLLELAERLDSPGLPDDLQRLRNIFDAYGKLDREAILAAAESLRGQRGLREKTRDALMRSGRYLPYMEKVFEQAGLPVLLTRLPLVESSFSNAAYSKSGAAGMWQFMPGTARIYMNYDEIGDERRDPWLATEAAAKHLRDDYELLQDWPLAITAYNFGRNGIARALAEIGGDSLMDMIQRYEHPRWGFAGKNFYAEFLAAVEVEQNALTYFGPIRRQDPEPLREVKTRHYVRYDTLRELAGPAAERFDELNPSFSEAVQQGHLYVPPGRRIRLPATQAPDFEQAYASLGGDQLFDRQRDYFVTHRVRRGETLSGIAHRYRTSIRSIRQANGLRSSHFIRIGQRLKVPTGHAGRATKPQYHVVNRGESLSTIAQRYGLKTRTLQRYNDIQRPELLQAGARLKLPGAATTFHRVRAGETLSAIARQYGVSVSALQQQNDIPRPELLRAGTRLQVAGARRRATHHVIRSGQTLESIARRYGLSVKAIASTNNIPDANRVRVGQRLRLPEG